jgi:DNA modification methylase
MTVRVLVGDALTVLRTLSGESVQTCVTSPPYWGLRDYGMAGQIGLETSPAEYVARLVEVFGEVRRVLRKDGTLWLNIGDSYTDAGRGADTGSTLQGTRHNQRESRKTRVRETAITGLRPKNLIGTPWRLALALQDDGWYLRSDIIWAKPNGMPESVSDRPTRSHEHVFLLSKSRRYFYDAAAVRTPLRQASIDRLAQRGFDAQVGSARANGGTRKDRPMKPVVGAGVRDGSPRPQDGMTKAEQQANGANLRDVWWIATVPNREAHFAMMPTVLAETCIRAGTRAGDTVLDPFSGAGTTGLAACRQGRDALLIELNPHYALMATQRISDEAPLLAEVVND